jgi:hypothetical protein
MSKKTPKHSPVANHPRKNVGGVTSQHRSDDGTAFLPDPYDGHGAPARAGEELAESLAEGFLTAATTAEDQAEDDRDAVNEEEIGGPFTETTAGEEFANGTDDSNPADAGREPFPTATRTPA